MTGTWRSCILTFACLAASSCASAPAAPRIPDKPDFSGKWVLVDAGGSPVEQATALVVSQQITRTNVYGAPIGPFYSKVYIERRFGTKAVSEAYDIGVIGGTVGGIPPGSSKPAEETRFRVGWSGTSLVIETGTYSGPTTDSGPYTEHEEVWSLDARRRLVITITDSQSGSETASVRRVYRRR